MLKAQNITFGIVIEYIMLLDILLVTYGCMSEWDKTCPEMSNAASTWIGLILGIAIGGIITWWVYNRQNKTSEKQEKIIEDIDKMVKKMERQEEMYRAHQEKILDKILRLDSKTDSILEKKDK